LNQILRRQTSRFHYGSKVPVVTITAFITILEQNRINSSQRSTKFSEEGGIFLVYYKTCSDSSGVDILADYVRT